MVLFPGCRCCNCDIGTPNAVEVTLSVTEAYHKLKYRVKWPNTSIPFWQFNPTFFETTVSSTLFVPGSSGTYSLTREGTSPNSLFWYRSANLSVGFTPNNPWFNLGPLDRNVLVSFSVPLRWAEREGGDTFSQATMSGSSWDTDVVAAGGSVCEWPKSGGGFSRPLYTGTASSICRRDPHALEYSVFLGIDVGDRGIYGPGQEKFGTKFVTQGGTGGFSAGCVLPVSMTMRPTFRIEDGRAGYPGYSEFEFLDNTLDAVTIGGAQWYQFSVPVQISSAKLIYDASEVAVFANPGYQTGLFGGPCP